MKITTTSNNGLVTVRGVLPKQDYFAQTLLDLSDDELLDVSVEVFVNSKAELNLYKKMHPQVANGYLAMLNARLDVINREFSRRGMCAKTLDDVMGDQ